MSQAEDLLNSLSATVIDHKHDVPDSDTYFLIDPYTRQIENTNYQKTVLMRGDHNSERFTFEVPRYVDGHDMSLCNRVIVHFDNVGDSIENIYSDVAYMDDLRINPDKPETVISSWLIRREATQIVGLLSFSIQYQCVEGDEITYEWNTDSYDDIEIRKSKQNGEAAIVQYTNVLEQWRSQIFGAGDSVMSNITTEGANQVAAVQTESATQQAAIELKGSETLATIPEDYTDVYNMASEALRTKADGVVCEVEGTAITVSDASDDYIRGLHVYGKSTQATTNGYQLFDASRLKTKSLGGVTITNNNDGSFTIAGSGTISESIWTYYTLTDAEYSEIVQDGNIIYVNAMPITNPFIFFGLYDEAGNNIASLSNRQGVSEKLTITQDLIDQSALARYYIIGNADSEVVSGTIKPMYYMEGDGSWEPYTGGAPAPNPDYPQEIVSAGDSGSITARLSSKNIATETHVEFTQHYFMKLGMTYPPGKYTFSAVISSTDIDADTCTVMFYAGENTSVRSAFVERSVNGERISFTTNIYDPFDALRFYASTGWGLSTDDTAIFSDIMLEVSDTVSDYEEPNVQDITVITTNKLPGIIDLRDVNGQTLIRDEIDLERGVYIQRLGNDVIDGSESVGVGTHSNGQKYAVVKRKSIANSGIISDRYIGHRWRENDKYTYTLSDNLVINDSRFTDVDTAKAILAEEKPRFIYTLATPIETPLTAEEIAAYKSLKSNYPNTTIINDAGAWMKFKYNADTKLYISNTVETGVVNVVEGVLNDTY